MNDDRYAALAAVYDDWQERYGNFASCALERLVPLLRAEDPPVTSFVDLGCGTGTLLLALATHPASSSWRLAGVDGSADMLARARDKPGATSVAWHHLPLGVPIPDPPFSAAAAFFNTLNHLPDVAELGRALASVGAALRPGGLFVFDVNNALGFSRWWNGLQHYVGAGWALQIDSTFEVREGRARARLRVTRDGTARSTEVTERLFSPDEIVASLRAAGMRPLFAEPWAPLGDGVPGATLWAARR